MPYPAQHDIHSINAPGMAYYRPVSNGGTMTQSDYLTLLDIKPFFRSEFVQVKARFERLREQLESSAGVSANWDSYGAEAPSAVAITNARRVLVRLESRSLLPARIVPSAEGGIGFCFLEEDKYADIECLNSNETLAVKYRGQEQPDVWEIGSSDDSLLEAIERIRVHLSI